VLRSAAPLRRNANGSTLAARGCLVADPERTLRRVAHFLDVPYTDEMLAYPRTGAAEMPHQRLA
jgi:hypothetical protein